MAGINSTINISMDKIIEITNVSTLQEFFIKGDQVMYGGNYWFIMLWVLFAVLFISSSLNRDEYLNNAMYSSGVVTIISFVIRAVYINYNGVVTGMITDHQLWIFPILSIILAILVYGTKK